MGSIYSTLKSPSSIFTGGEGGDDVGIWTETTSAYVLRVDLPWLKKHNSVSATLVECCDEGEGGIGYVTKVKVTGEVTTALKTFGFTKLIKLPHNGVMVFRGGDGVGVGVVVSDGFFIVTVPKVEEV